MRKSTKTEDSVGNGDPDPLNILEEDFLLEAMDYFDIDHVSVDRGEDVNDILCYPFDDPPRILVGPKWFAASQPERMKRLTHEFLHIYGYNHNANMNSHGYFSDPDRDDLSMKVFRDIMDGETEFYPGKFGMNRPRKRDKNGKD